MPGEKQQSFWNSLVARDAAVEVTGTRTITSNEQYVLARMRSTAGGGAYTITLPDPALMKYKSLIIEVLDDASGDGNAITVSCSQGSLAFYAKLRRAGDILVAVSTGRRWVLENVGPIWFEQHLSLFALRSATGLELTASETAGTFNRNITSEVLVVRGEVTISETEVSVGYMDLVLPENYVPGTNLTIKFLAKLTGSGTNNGSTLDLEAFRQQNGAVGADICSTTAKSPTTSYAEYSFTITGTTLTAGDHVILKITSSVIESGGSSLTLDIAEISALMQMAA